MLHPSEPPGSGAQRSPAEEPRLAQAVRLVAAGHEPSLRVLFDATSARAYGVAKHVLADAALAEEAVADAYAQVWRDARQYDPSRTTVKSWIAMIVRARAIDLRRRHGMRASCEEALETAAGAESAAEGPAHRAVSEERGRLVRDALTSLPREQRVAVEAAFFGGLTHVEVAAKLGAPLGTVKSRIRTALACLRHDLDHLETELR